MRAFLPPLLLFLAIVASAPAIGHVRDFIFETFPRAGVLFLATAFAVTAAGFFLYAVVRIVRSGRWLRFAGLAGVVALLWIQTVGLATDQAQVDAVEKVHVLQYGLLAFLLYRALMRRRAGAGDPATVANVLFAVTLAGTADEWVQWLAPQRTGDVRDVALNATAGLSGLLFALCLGPPATWSWRLAARRRLLPARGAAVTVLGLGLFFFVAHLGYEIEDPEIGRFRSRFTAAELAELAARRRVEWAREPPTGLETWGVEDYFLTEASWHANHRNASYRSGLASHAWLANRVLEKYYDPFLDLESFRGSGRHRYEAAVRRELEEKKGRIDTAAYLSPVLAEVLHPWPKPHYLAVLALAVAGLWRSPRRLAKGSRRSSNMW